jgi:chromosome segregation ATPase
MRPLPAPRALRHTASQPALRTLSHKPPPTKPANQSFSPYGRPTHLIVLRGASDIRAPDLARAQRIESARQALAARRAERDALRAALNRRRLLSVSRCSSFLILADAVHGLSLRLFVNRSARTQTELTGSTFDFHARILRTVEQEAMAISDSDEKIKALRGDIAKRSDLIRAAQAEATGRQVRIHRIKEELRSARVNIERNEVLQRSEAQMRAQVRARLQELKLTTRQQQAALDAKAEEIAEATARLEDLAVIRNSLDRDLEDAAQREKPEVQTLATEVQAYQQRVAEARERFASAEEHLRRRRATLEEIRQSEDVRRYKDLIVRRAKLERRILKWKMLLKDAHETLQSMEAYSAQNLQKRQTLSKAFEKAERAKIETDEELRELELYSDLLAALLREQFENWR